MYGPDFRECEYLVKVIGASRMRRSRADFGSCRLVPEVLAAACKRRARTFFRLPHYGIQDRRQRAQGVGYVLIRS